MTISGFAAYVKQLWKNKPDTSTPLSADRLLHIEDGIKGNSDAIEKIATAVVDQIVNDPNKIASMAALYSVNQAVNSLNSDLAVIKSGKITSSLAAGGSYTYEIAFKTPFVDTNYVIKLELNTLAYTYYVSEKTISGFKLFVYANNTASGVSIFWEATRSKDFQ